jgi:hypothetical protein
MEVIANGKRIGTVHKGTLIKSGKAVVLFRNYGGFGVPEEVLKNAFIHKVQVHYEGRTYEAHTDTFERKGIKYHQPPYEPQVILPRKYWSIEDSKQPQLSNKLFKENKV